MPETSFNVLERVLTCDCGGEATQVSSDYVSNSIHAFTGSNLQIYQILCKKSL